jgi:hypothetical protein
MPKHIDSLIAHLEQIRDAGGELYAYELTPKLEFYDPDNPHWLVSFRAEIVTPQNWEMRLE